MAVFAGGAAVSITIETIPAAQTCTRCKSAFDGPPYGPKAKNRWCAACWWEWQEAYDGAQAALKGVQVRIESGEPEEVKAALDLRAAELKKERIEWGDRADRAQADLDEAEEALDDIAAEERAILQARRWVTGRRQEQLIAAGQLTLEGTG